MRDDLHANGLRTIENRAKMPLLSEDVAKGEYLYQEVREDGIISVAQKMVTGFSPKQLATFGYAVERFYGPISDNRAEFQLVSEDGGVVTHHQRMLTPWIISNRSLFVTTYHKHSDALEGQYTMIRSSEGNSKIQDANAEIVLDDVEADMILFWVNCIPMTSTMSKVQFIMHLNLGGSLPGPLRAKIASKQAELIITLQTMFATNAADMTESFNQNESKILANINLQKEEREAVAKAIEDKKLRKEAKAKRIADAKAIKLQEVEAVVVPVTTGAEEYKKNEGDAAGD